MKTTTHPARLTLGLAVVVVSATFLASCGGSDSEGVEGPDTVSASSPVTESSDLPVTEVPVDTSATPVTEPAGTAPVDTAPVTQTPVTQTPVTETPTTEAPPETTPVTEPAPVEVASGGYEPISSPTFDSLLDNEKSDPIVDPLPDGQYWSWDYTSDGSSVTFSLVQYFYGDACREQFGDSEDACASDNDTLYSPSVDVTMAADAPTSVVWCCNDEGQFQSYRISTDEFVSLLAGAAPSPDAPADFAFERYAVVVTVQNGQAITADQVFTS